VDVLERLEVAGVTVVWDYEPGAPLAVYSDNPPELTLGYHAWHATPPRERERVVCHELAHHRLGIVYAWSDAPEDQSTIRWLEAKVDRESLPDFISEDAIWEARAQGCETVDQFAALWGLAPSVVAARLRLLAPWR